MHACLVDRVQMHTYASRLMIMNDSSTDAVPRVPLLPGESIEMVFDARNGLLSESDPRGEALVVTNERVLRDGVAEGARVVSMFPLSDLAAVEVSDSGRSLERLGQGIVLAAVGLVLGGLSWFILEIQVLSVVLGGLPILAGIYMLTGWAFPDTEGALHLYAPGHAIALPLRSATAREGVYAAMRRIYELRWVDPAALEELEAVLDIPVAAEPEAEEEPQTMEAELNKLVEEVDENTPEPPEQPKSFWDIFRRKS